MRLVDPQEPEVEAERPVPVDLTPLLERDLPADRVVLLSRRRSGAPNLGP